MCHHCRTRRHAFTIVEVLIVIAIIGILIALLFPMASNARRMAIRTQDVSNIGQFARSCLTYASANRGELPLGQRENATATGFDDMVWVRWSTYDLLVKTYGLPQKAMSCNAQWEQSWFETLYGKRPSGTGTYAGWIYFGNRTGIGPPRQFPSNQPYVLPRNLRDKPTSRTLATCWSYISPNSWSGYLPHYARSNEVKVLPGGQPNPYVDRSDGLSVCYTDGSARWVIWDDMVVLRDVNWHWYDPK